jgi:hypothetical protein
MNDVCSLAIECATRWQRLKREKVDGNRKADDEHNEDDQNEEEEMQDDQLQSMSVIRKDIVKCEVQLRALLQCMKQAEAKQFAAVNEHADTANDDASANDVKNVSEKIERSYERLIEVTRAALDENDLYEERLRRMAREAAVDLHREATRRKQAEMEIGMLERRLKSIEEYLAKRTASVGSKSEMGPFEAADVLRIKRRRRRSKHSPTKDNNEQKEEEEEEEDDDDDDDDGDKEKNEKTSVIAWDESWHA